MKRDATMKTKTYWVEYTYYYTYIDVDSGERELVEDYDSGRVKCRKKDIKKEVAKRIREECEDDPSVELSDDIELTITDCYETTEYEI